MAFFDPNEEALKAAVCAICNNCILGGITSRPQIEALVAPYKPNFPRLSVDMVEGAIFYASNFYRGQAPSMMWQSPLGPQSVGATEGTESGRGTESDVQGGRKRKRAENLDGNEQQSEEEAVSEGMKAGVVNEREGTQQQHAQAADNRNDGEEETENEEVVDAEKESGGELEMHPESVAENAKESEKGCTTEDCPVKNHVAVTVPREDVENLLELKFHLGQLHAVQFSESAKKNKGERPAFVRKQFKDAVPNFRYTLDQTHVLDVDVTDGRPVHRRGGSRKKHPFLIRFAGYCRHKSNGCTTRFTAGIEQTQLQRLSDVHCDAIEMKMIIVGSCDHGDEEPPGPGRPKGVIRDKASVEKEKQLRKLLMPAEYQEEEHQLI